ncbi:AMP-dependent synthetase and ligase [gamma proteobacterium HdN1]|nr:AMP-dependent synthetase and ligase [gamma proteobacterium HdN1]
MSGSLMQGPLLISDLLTHAETFHSHGEIVSRTVEGPIHRYTYKDASQRAKQLANLLESLGVQHGDRVASLAWNGYRHYELYFAVSGMGAIMHTINPRLFPEQIEYILQHAEDKLLCVDLSFLPIVQRLLPQLPHLERIIVLTDDAHMPADAQQTLSKGNHPPICYESELAKHNAEYEWPRFSDDAGAVLCYTSGTTGKPKGVLYSHRSQILHAYASVQPDAMNLSSHSCVLPVVPMFHVSAWGVPYSCTLTGAKMVFPGARMDGAALAELIEDEKADFLLGVPTVWLGLLDYLRQNDKKLHTVQRVVVGGSAAPLAMIKEFQEVHDVFLIHAWGMTEMSPLGTLCTPTARLLSLPLDQRYQYQRKQGRPVFGVALKIVDAKGEALPHDGSTFGRLMVKGPWVIERYYRSDASALENGWFDTGDVATIDPEGYMQIVDRTKDVIKSGGEWISSIELENIAVGHPDVQEACVVGVPHPKWDERPLLLVIAKPNHQPTRESLLQYFEGKVAKWWIPDDAIVVKELPHTATGKLLKISVRETHQKHYL